MADLSIDQRKQPKADTLPFASKARKSATHLGDCSAEALHPTVASVINSPGQPLGQRTQSRMESFFRADLSQVRVHTDSQAAQSARFINSNAYALGSHLVFGPGQYAPETNTGQRLLAHELSHVVQQSGNANQSSTALAVSSPSNNLEREADQASNAYTAAGRAELSHGQARQVARQVSDPTLEPYLERINRFHEQLSASYSADELAAFLYDELRDVDFASGNALEVITAHISLLFGNDVASSFAGMAGVSRPTASGVDERPLTPDRVSSTREDRAGLERAASEAAIQSEAENLPQESSGIDSRLQQALQRIRSLPFGEILARGISTPQEYGTRMSQAARRDAEFIINKLTENWVDDDDEEQVIAKLSLWAAIPKLDDGNYLDEVLDYLKSRTLIMDYLIAESAPANYLDQLFDEMEDDRQQRLRSLIESSSQNYRGYRPRRGVSIVGSIPSAVINELRALQRAGLRRLRAWAAGLSGAERTAADILIGVLEATSDVLISTLIAIAGLVQGAISELVGMIEGLARLALGIMKAALLFLYGFIDGGERFDQYMNETVEMLRNLPAALRQVLNQWITEFEQATPDEQTWLIGELTGRIIATIATFGFTVGKAGKLSGLRFTVEFNVRALQPAYAGARASAVAAPISLPVGAVAQPAAAATVAIAQASQVTQLPAQQTPEPSVTARPTSEHRTSGERAREPYRGAGREQMSKNYAHDLGVQQGDEMARAQGLIEYFENPRGIDRTTPGFDRIYRDGTDLVIVEFKGGEANLSPGQMGNTWVNNEILALERQLPQGHPVVMELRDALQSGRLKGRTYSTRIDQTGAPLETTFIDHGVYTPVGP